MTRVRIGIEDLWLGGLPLFAEKPNDAAAATAAATAAVDGTATEAAAAVDVTAASAAAAVTRPWVALGKHLCGAASDFTLRCAQQCLDSNTGAQALQILHKRWLVQSHSRIPQGAAASINRNHVAI